LQRVDGQLLLVETPGQIKNLPRQTAPDLIFFLSLALGCGKQLRFFGRRRHPLLRSCSSVRHEQQDLFRGAKIFPPPWQI
jgi:hypothetical protein